MGFLSGLLRTFSPALGKAASVAEDIVGDLSRGQGLGETLSKNANRIIGGIGGLAKEAGSFIPGVGGVISNIGRVAEEAFDGEEERKLDKQVEEFRRSHPDARKSLIDAFIASVEDPTQKQKLDEEIAKYEAEHKNHSNQAADHLPVLATDNAIDSMLTANVSQQMGTMPGIDAPILPARAPTALPSLNMSPTWRQFDSPVASNDAFMERVVQEEPLVYTRAQPRARTLLRESVARPRVRRAKKVARRRNYLR